MKRRRLFLLGCVLYASILTFSIVLYAQTTPDQQVLLAIIQQRQENDSARLAELKQQQDALMLQVQEHSNQIATIHGTEIGFGAFIAVLQATQILIQLGKRGPKSYEP